jgi:predicted SnoaL-like aldol condensation-catalyzing enzyme
MVMTHSEGDYGDIRTAIWDLYRIENGKIIEHWSAIWEKDRPPATFQHNNTIIREVFNR